jgi:hypothetical protein
MGLSPRPVPSPSVTNVVSFFNDQRAQIGLEYLLATAALAVVIAGGLVAGFQLVVPKVLDTICDAVDPLRAAGTSCLTLL